MKKFSIILALGLVASSTEVLAISNPFDAVAGVIIKNGSPCFYSVSPLNARPPAFMQGRGMGFTVFNDAAKHTLWETWHAKWVGPLPSTPAHCVAYGTRSKDQNNTPAQKLPYNTPLTFFMDGEYGSQTVSFCIRKDGQGHSYLSTVVNQDGLPKCTSEPLKNTDPHN